MIDLSGHYYCIASGTGYTVYVKYCIKISPYGCTAQYISIDTSPISGDNSLLRALAVGAGGWGIPRFHGAMVFEIRCITARQASSSRNVPRPASVVSEDLVCMEKDHCLQAAPAQAEAGSRAQTQQ